MIYFEWDENKANKNRRVHGIDFEEASFVFDDPFRLTEDDSVVAGERRFRTTGRSNGVVVMLVIHLEETGHVDTFVRIISARKATRSERSRYEESNQA